MTKKLNLIFKNVKKVSQNFSVYTSHETNFAVFPRKYMNLNFYTKLDCQWFTFMQHFLFIMNNQTKRFQKGFSEFSIKAYFFWEYQLLVLWYSGDFCIFRELQPI